MFEKRIAKIEERLGMKDTKNTTRVLIIQDRSGSMQTRTSETISGYNEYVNSLKQDDSDEAFLTLVQFDDRYEVREENTPIGEVKDLNEDTYVPRGTTSLLDAVGKGITDLKSELGDEERALVIIMTDGMENTSRAWSKNRVIDLIRSCEETERWTFVFLGAGQDAWSGGDLLGLRREQTVYYGADSHSHERAYASLASTTNFLRGGERGHIGAAGLITSDRLAKEGGTVKSSSVSAEDE